MEYTRRKAADNLDIAKHIDYLKLNSFYHLTEKLAKVFDYDMENIDRYTINDSLFHFKSAASMAFPASEISKLEYKLDETGIYAPKFNIDVTFMGLQGSVSSLPGILLDKIAYEEVNNESIINDYFNFFNHRMITLLHKSWRKYRYYIKYKPNAEDDFSSKMFSFIGLGDLNFREHATVNNVVSNDINKNNCNINWVKLLSYMGLIMIRSRSPTTLSNIIAHYFGLREVKILEWQKQSVSIPPRQRNNLGMANATLGDNFIIGSSIITKANKFVIEINRLDINIFHKFLPNGEFYAVLKTLVSFLLREQLPYDIRLGIIKKDVPKLILEEDNKIYLGWSSFISEKGFTQDATINITGAT